MRPLAPPAPLDRVPLRAAALPGRCDVAVVGGGLPGLVAAVELARAGADVVVVEARAQLGDGASGRAHGLVYAGLTEHPWRLVASLGAAEAGALLAFADRGLDRIDARGLLDRRGLVWASAEREREPAEIDRSVVALAALGRTARPLSAAEVALCTGAVGLGPGFLVEAEGVVDPVDVVRALEAEASAAGVRLAAPVRAQGLASEADALRVLTDRGDLRAEAVVLAGEAGLRQVHPFFADTLTPVREAATLFAGGPPLSRALRAGFGWTVARRLGEHTLVSGCRFATPHLEEGEVDDTIVAEAVAERLAGFAQRFLPGVGAPVASWSWITAHGCDGLPIVGPLPTDPRVVVAAGFAGHEASFGIAAGRAVADGLVHGRAEGVPRSLSSFRFL